MHVAQDRWRITVLVAGALCAAGLSPVAAENWPCWRGAQRTGISTETAVPLQWTAEEHVAWKIELPAASSTTAWSYAPAIIASPPIPDASGPR